MASCTRHDLLRIFVRDLDSELLFEGHNQLDDIERVSTENVGKARLRGNLVGVHTQLLDNNAFDFLCLQP